MNQFLELVHIKRSVSSSTLAQTCAYAFSKVLHVSYLHFRHLSLNVNTEDIRKNPLGSSPVNTREKRKSIRINSSDPGVSYYPQTSSSDPKRLGKSSSNQEVALQHNAEVVPLARTTSAIPEQNEHSCEINRSHSL